MQSSRDLWDHIERLRLLPTGEASRVKTRWFREDRADANDANAFARWLVTNGYLTKFDVEQMRAGKIDQLRLGQYLLLEPCAVGPHQGAYYASDTLGRKVLLDLVDEKLAGDPDLVRAFESAAERAMSVQSPHVNRVLDFGQAQGRLYLVRELDEGTTLDEVLERRDRLDATHTAKIFSQAFAGLQALHEKQAQGGDLTARSLLLATTGKKGRVVKLLRPCMPAALFSETSSSAAELIPQLRPLSRPEDDLFRLGQTFYRTLTGKPSSGQLSGGGSVRAIAELAPEVPELLAETVEQMLSPDVSARPRAASRVAKTLRVFLASEEETQSQRAEEEIASPNEVIQAKAVEEEAEDDEEPAVRPRNAPEGVQGKAMELWDEIKPQQRDWLFLAAGSVGVVVLVLLLMLLTGIHFINIVCLLTGAAISFFAERLWIQRQGEMD